MGLVLVVFPADFPAHPHPAWNYYDALPPPIGWLLVLSGIQALIRTTEIDLRATRTAAFVAFALSIPMWFPQINHYVVPQYNPGVSQSWQWLVALPSWAFGYFFSQAIGDTAMAREPRERGIAGWFGLLRWGFIAAAVMPAVVYGADLRSFDTTMHMIIGMVEIGLMVAMFTYHRRVWLGGPGPRVWVTPQERAAAKAEAHDEPDSPTPTPPLPGWAEFKAERERAREEMRARRQARRQKADRPE